jgi:hypothetical protein
MCYFVLGILVLNKSSRISAMLMRLVQLVLIHSKIQTFCHWIALSLNLAIFLCNTFRFYLMTRSE